MKSVVMVCLHPGADRGAVERDVAKELGFAGGPDHRWRWHEPGLLSVRLKKVVAKKARQRLKALPAVRRIVELSSDRPLALRGKGRRDAPVPLPNGVVVGAPHLAVVAGPCSVESESQVCEIAAMVKEAGADALRGGVFKPRTSPYSFGGLGGKGLEHLALAREKTGLPVVTEVLETSEIDVVARHSDVIQVGSRNMHNYPLLFKAGSHPSGKPVLLKRGFGATLEEFLWAAEYVLVGRVFAGTDEPGLILCERGIRTFAQSTRFTLDAAAIPVLKERSHLPVIVDPSHLAGQRRYVTPLASAAVAAGADGLIVEAHTQPSRAWCDADQCLGPTAFGKMMKEVRAIAAVVRD